MDVADPANLKLERDSAACPSLPSPPEKKNGPTFEALRTEFRNCRLRILLLLVFALQLSTFESNSNGSGEFMHCSLSSLDDLPLSAESGTWRPRPFGTPQSGRSHRTLQYQFPLERSSLHGRPPSSPPGLCPDQYLFECVYYYISCGYFLFPCVTGENGGSSHSSLFPVGY